MAAGHRVLILRVLALAFWVACVVAIAIPRPASDAAKPTVAFRQPAQPMPSWMKRLQK
jgi:hypothetical protein